MSDINCAHCREPWEVYGLRHDGWDYLNDAQAKSLNVWEQFQSAGEGDRTARYEVSNAVYKAVLSGRGCPSSTCGFVHDREGPFREAQLGQLVFGGVTDDDPLEFM